MRNLYFSAHFSIGSSSCSLAQQHINAFFRWCQAQSSTNEYKHNPGPFSQDVLYLLAESLAQDVCLNYCDNSAVECTSIAGELSSLCSRRCFMLIDIRSAGFTDCCGGRPETVFCQTLRGHREEVLFWSGVAHQVSPMKPMKLNHGFGWSFVTVWLINIVLFIVGAVCYRQSLRNFVRPGSRRFKPASPRPTERVQTIFILRFVLTIQAEYP